MKEKIKKHWKIFLLIVIITILPFLIFGTKKYFDNVQTANRYETFFKQIDKNVLGDYFESQKLYLESARINDELKGRDDYESSEHEDLEKQLKRLVTERWERLKRATEYVDELETEGDSDLKELKGYLAKSINYNTGSAEGDWLRVDRIICLADQLRLKRFSSEKCGLTEEQKLKVNTHGEKWKLGLSEFRKLKETASEKVIALKSPKCKKCAEIILSWTEKEEKLTEEEF